MRSSILIIAGLSAIATAGPVGVALRVGSALFSGSGSSNKKGKRSIERDIEYEDALLGE